MAKFCVSKGKQMNNNPNQQGGNNMPPNNNNFFNKNPILIFAVFAIIAILLFRSFNDSPTSLASNALSSEPSRNIAYSELKKLIESNQIARVDIGQTTIRAISKQNAVFTTQKVSNDLGLSPCSMKRALCMMGVRQNATGFWI